MALTANRNVNEYTDQKLRKRPLKAGVHVYKGAVVVVEESSGYILPYVAGSGNGTANHFYGLAYEEGDNTGGSNGDISVRVYTQGDYEHDIPGATIADIGKKVYASADDTLALTPNIDANVFIGRVQDWISGTKFVVRLHGVADVGAV